MRKGGKIPLQEKKSGSWKEEGENNGVRNESSGVGGYETEICTNLRLLVMSGDKLHRQKESGWRMGARMERWWRTGERGWRGRERDNAIISIADIAISACALPAARGDPLCRVSR